MGLNCDFEPNKKWDYINKFSFNPDHQLYSASILSVNDR